MARRGKRPSRCIRTRQVGGRFLLRHQSNLQNFWTIGLTNEFQHSTIDPEALRDFTIRDDLIALGLDPTTGQSRGTLSALVFDISRNTTNNLLNATQGYLLSGHVEQAGKWLWGSYNFWSATAEARHFATFGRDGDAGHPTARRHDHARAAITRRTCRSTAGSSSADRRASADGGGSM